MKNLRYVALAALFLLTVRFTLPTADQPSLTAVADESQQANEFFERVYNESIDRDPVMQTYLGIKKDYDQWDDPTEEFAQMELNITQEDLQWLKDSIDYDALNPATQLSYDLFVQKAENEIADFKYRYHTYPVNQMFGFHSQVPSFLINMHQVSSVEDAEAYVKRFAATADLLRSTHHQAANYRRKGNLAAQIRFPPCDQRCAEHHHRAALCR